jgi:hypothetical protein
MLLGIGFNAGIPRRGVKESRDFQNRVLDSSCSYVLGMHAKGDMVLFPDFSLLYVRLSIVLIISRSMFFRFSVR